MCRPVWYPCGVGTHGRSSYLAQAPMRVVAHAAVRELCGSAAPCNVDQGCRSASEAKRTARQRTMAATLPQCASARPAQPMRRLSRCHKVARSYATRQGRVTLASLAQWSERVSYMHQAAGSIPARRTAHTVARQGTGVSQCARTHEYTVLEVWRMQCLSPLVE